MSIGDRFQHKGLPAYLCLAICALLLTLLDSNQITIWVYMPCSGLLSLCLKVIKAVYIVRVGLHLATRIEPQQQLG